MGSSKSTFKKEVHVFKAKDLYKEGKFEDAMKEYD